MLKRWLRKTFEPLLGEGLIRTVESLQNKGVPPSVLQFMTDKALQYGPDIIKKTAQHVAVKSLPYMNEAVGQFLDRAPTRAVRMFAPAILDGIPSVINPTFDSPPSQPIAQQANFTSSIPSVRKKAAPAKTRVKNVINVAGKKRKGGAKR